MLDYLAFFAVSLVWFLFWYFVPNGLVYWLFWTHRAFDHQRIQAGRPLRDGQIGREVRLSVRTLTIYSAIATLCFLAYRHGWTAVDWSMVGGGRIIGSTILLMLIYDTWFYWMHRLLHWKPIYVRFHRQHHQSLAPTPWASYSFSCTEAIANCPLWALCFFVPVHPLGILLGLFIQNAYDTFGHSGYEFFPRWALRNRVICALHATPTHHDCHHRFFTGNFGHYFNIWDFIMNTELERYKDIHNDVCDQLPGESASGTA